MSGFRLNLRDGVGTALIEKEVNFTFDGTNYKGKDGDTLASALLANGVSIVARSFKYHRPRGIFSAGSEEPNALVTLHSGGRTEPNIRATEVELYNGLVARSQNSWPTVNFDVMAVNQLAYGRSTIQKWTVLALFGGVWLRLNSCKSNPSA